MTTVTVKLQDTLGFGTCFVEAPETVSPWATPPSSSSPQIRLPGHAPSSPSPRIPALGRAPRPAPPPRPDPREVVEQEVLQPGGVYSP